jgi:DNA-binding MurR/RpiR family transcriptional regulator
MTKRKTPVATFDERISSKIGGLSPAEQRVARFFQENRAEVLHASAASLSAKMKTSDATVIRTTRSLGFKGLDDLREVLAAEFGQGPTMTGRLSETLREVGNDPTTAFQATLDIHVRSIENLRRDISTSMFRKAVQIVGKARRVVIFGIGPSSAMASYWAIQLGRFGFETLTFMQTGLLFADDLRKLRAGDVVIMMAYGRVYDELSVLLEESERLGLKSLLLTDGLGGRVQDKVSLILPVARGRADLLSMHTATLSLIEALLVGIAAEHPDAALQSVEKLNGLRAFLAGRPMDIAGRDGDDSSPRRGRPKPR